VTAEVTSTNGASSRYVHDALLYGSDEELLNDAVPFLRAGVDLGETAIVVCTDRPAALLRAAFGSDRRITFLSAAAVYGRTSQAILAYQQLLEQETAAGASRVRIVGEPVYGHDPATWPERMRYEAIINRALAPYPVWGVCLYDTRQLPAEVVTAAELTHPHLRTGGTRAANPRYLDPAEFLCQFPDPEPDPLETTVPTVAVDEVRNLRRLRQRLNAAVAGSTLPAWTTGEFVFAVSEIVTNAMRHGRPPVRVRMWVTPDRLLCTVTDVGPGVDDPLAGYVPAHRNPARGGLGLWLARRLCDHVELRRTPEGFTVRLATGT
jgi:anti-sigma regulatory factor (Ser/Thr protein kinase)